MDPKAILGILGPLAAAVGGVAAGLGLIFLLDTGMGSVDLNDPTGSLSGSSAS